MPRVALVIIAMLAGLTLVRPATAQSFNVVYNFTGAADGANPIGGVTVDAAGNLYGTASAGGRFASGNVYRLVHSGSNWIFYLVYTFRGLNNYSDGIAPMSRVVIGPDGYLYGTTRAGGFANGCREDHGCGTVFKVQPKPGGGPLDPWQETVLYKFGYYDGDHPYYGDVVFDRSGNLYGATRDGGAYLNGAVYELSPSGITWSQKVIYSFSGQPDGANPLDGPAFDQAGNLYGTASAGGANGHGTVYQLKPVGAGWSEAVLHSFQNVGDGMQPSAGVMLDTAGNLYGATQDGGAAGGGTVFQLQSMGGGLWNLNSLYSLSGPAQSGPATALVMDSAGNLYGTTPGDGAYHQGSVFKLTWSSGGWTYATLHDFTGGPDGGTPYGRLALDANGNLYGTASAGGLYGDGVVFTIATR